MPTVEPEAARKLATSSNDGIWCGSHYYGHCVIGQQKLNASSAPHNSGSNRADSLLPFGAQSTWFSLRTPPVAGQRNIMVDSLSRLAQLAENSIAQLSVRSALNSTLWLSGVTVPFGLLGTVLTVAPVQWFMVALMMIGPTTSVAGFAYFALTDPDKLRSETYELRKTALSLIEEKGVPIPLEATSVEAITNSEYPAQLLKKLGDNGE